MTIVWEGVFTEKDGTKIKATFVVDGGKLARWFSKSSHNDQPFKKARKGRVTAERMGGGIVVTLEPVTEDQP